MEMNQNKENLNNNYQKLIFAKNKAPINYLT